MYEFNVNNQKITLDNKTFSADEILQTDFSVEPEYRREIFTFLKEWFSPSDSVLLRTSGSTGVPKTFFAEKKRMMRSASMTCGFFGWKAGQTALLCLSPEYIAGKMMLVRALVSGVNVLAVEPSGHPLAQVSERLDFAAMVPLQIYNSLQNLTEKERLAHIANVIVGGGAIDDRLAKTLKAFPNALWSTYGMTETLSHIALRRLSGAAADDFYTPLPSVALTQDADGCLQVFAPEICAETLCTNDIAEFAPDGRFRILGRRDNVICSGGIKLQIEKIEQKLKNFISVPFLITKRKDVKFGEIIVLLVQAEENENFANICRSVLSEYEIPRVIISVKEIPLTPTGKPARAEAERLAR